MAVIDSALRRKFRRTVEERLDVAATNNARMILAWELSPSFEHVALTCHGDTFHPHVIDHLATSLTRVLGVGKRMGLVNHAVNDVTIECTGLGGSTETLLFRYPVA